MELLMNYVEVFSSMKFLPDEREYWTWLEKEWQQKYYNDGFEYARKRQKENEQTNDFGNHPN